MRTSIAATGLVRVLMSHGLVDMGCLLILDDGDQLEIEGATGLGDYTLLKGIIGAFPITTLVDLGAGHVKSKRTGSMRRGPMTALVLMESGGLPSGATAGSLVVSALAPTPASNDECGVRTSAMAMRRGAIPCWIAMVIMHLEARSNDRGHLRARGAVSVGSRPCSPSLLPLPLPCGTSTLASRRSRRGTRATTGIRCRAWAVGAHRDMSPSLWIVRPFMIAMGTYSRSMPIWGTTATTTAPRSAALGGRSANGAGGGLPSASGSTLRIAERGLSDSVRA